METFGPPENALKGMRMNCLSCMTTGSPVTLESPSTVSACELNCSRAFRLSSASVSGCCGTPAPPVADAAAFAAPCAGAAPAGAGVPPAFAEASAAASTAFDSFLSSFSCARKSSGYFFFRTSFVIENVDSSIEGSGFSISSCDFAAIWALSRLMNSLRSVLPSLSNFALMAS